MRKGFTLVEIIAVIVILGLITLLSFPIILNAIKKTENNLSLGTKNLIYSASSQYINSHINDYSKTKGNVYCITLDTLVKENLLPATIQNEGLGDFGLQTKVKITISDDKYDYDIDNSCVEVK